jgi:IS5 family transposase
VLSRILNQAKVLVEDMVEGTKGVCRDRTRSARNQARQIANYARQRSAKAKANLKGVYQRLIKTTQASVQQAQTALSVLKSQSSQTAAHIVDVLETFIPRVEQALAQTIRRVLQGESVPAPEKILSLFEPHTTVIRRGKAGKETEFGHKVWLDEVDGGIVTQWRVLEGNPADADQWQPALDHHLKQFKKPPHLASADRGVYSPDNEAYARQQGVKQVVLPKPGYKSKARREFEAQSWFKRGRRFQAGIEGRISVCKRKHGLARCLDHGKDGFDKWVGWGVIANNFTVMGRTLAAKIT